MLHVYRHKLVFTVKVDFVLGVIDVSIVRSGETLSVRSVANVSNFSHETKQLCGSFDG